MAFVNTMDKLGDEVTISKIIERSITEYFDNSVQTIAGNALQACTELEIVDTPALTSIASSSFSGCSTLITLVLRNSTMTALGSNVFKNTPIASGTGYIYVPRALVDSYKVATNWATYAAQFRALEDYTVDGTVTGDLDESKI